VSTSREKQLTLLAAVLGTSVVFLDATVTSVALPAIRGDLGGGLAGQEWVTNAPPNSSLNGRSRAEEQAQATDCPDEVVCQKKGGK
jgi:hypothetical protein